MRVRLDHVTSEARRTVDASVLGADEVFLYSIPAWDETGDGERVDPDEIGSGKLLLQGGEVLISKLNPRKPRVLVAQRHDIPTICSSEFVALQPRAIESAFLTYWLLSESTRQTLDANVQSVTRSQQRVRPEQLTKMWLDLPAPSEQRAIADFLDAETARIDALIAKKQRLATLRLQHFVAEVRALACKQSGLVPLRRHVASIKTGTTPAEELRDDADRPGGAEGGEQQIAWYSPGDFGDLLELKPATRTVLHTAVAAGAVPTFPAASTLVVGIGATAGKVAHLDASATGNQQVTCLAAGRGLLPRFLSWQLYGRRDELLGTAPYTTLPILNNDFLKALPLFVPSLDEQAHVVSVLDGHADRLSRLTDALDRQVALLQERRQALITAAVTGQMEIPAVAA